MDAVCVSHNLLVQVTSLLNFRCSLFCFISSMSSVKYYKFKMIYENLQIDNVSTSYKNRSCSILSIQRYGRNEAWFMGSLDGWMDGWVGGWMDGWLDGRMDGWLDGWMDGWMDRWIDG